MDLQRHYSWELEASRNHMHGLTTASRPIKCTFCDAPHFSNECTKMTGYSSRLEVVKEKKLCFNCLGKHQVSKCPSTKRCWNCKHKHHTSLCNARDNGSEVNKDAPVPNTPMNAVLQDDEAVFQLSTAQKPSHVLLKTAIAPVSSSTYCSHGNILFDEGTQSSFISSKLAKTLQLTPDGTDVEKLATSGDTSKTV